MVVRLLAVSSQSYSASFSGLFSVSDREDWDMREVLAVSPSLLPRTMSIRRSSLLVVINLFLVKPTDSSHQLMVNNHPFMVSSHPHMVSSHPHMVSSHPPMVSSHPPMVSSHPPMDNLLLTVNLKLLFDSNKWTNCSIHEPPIHLKLQKLFESLSRINPRYTMPSPVIRQKNKDNSTFGLKKFKYFFPKKAWTVCYDLFKF